MESIVSSNSEEFSNNNNQFKIKRNTCCGQIFNIIKNTTVEPLAFLSMFSSILSELCTQTLALEKTCRVSFELGDEICYSLRIQNQSNDFSIYEKIIQEHYSKRLMWKSVLQSVLPCILILFVGGWSDKTGRRRIIMFVPLLGGLLQSTSNIINVIFFYQLPLDVLVFFDVLFINITGGTSIMFLAFFNYICDITTIENRTHRTGIFNLCSLAGIPLGLSMSGVILKNLGYLAIYGLCLAVYVINLTYIFLRISDTARTEEQLAYDKQNTCQFLKTFFDPSSVKNMFAVVFKKTGNNRSIHLCLLIGITIFLFGPIYAELSVSYISTRYRFNWNELRFSIFQTYSFIMSAIGTICMVIVLGKILKWHDSIMGIISSLSRIFASFVLCFAPNEKIFFVGPALDMFNGGAIIAVRSLYSKLLESNEIGKVNSLVSLIDTLMPLLYTSLYTKLYTMTMDVLPGGFYLVAVVITFPALLVFIWLLLEHKKDLRRVKMKVAIGSQSAIDKKINK